MAQNTNDGCFKTSISLQGGGRLDQIDEIVSVKVDPGEIKLSKQGSDITLDGEVRAYVYFTRVGSQTIEGEGIRIPFTRRVQTPALKEPIKLAIEDVKSDYDYNAISGHFEHEITLQISLSESSASTEDSQAHGETANTTEQRDGDDLENRQLGERVSRRQETVISQVRVGPPPSNPIDSQVKVDEAEITSNSVESPDAITESSQDVTEVTHEVPESAHQRSEVGHAEIPPNHDDDVPETNTGHEEVTPDNVDRAEVLDPEPTRDGTVTNPGGEDRSPSNVDSTSQDKDPKVIVWKAFPPPIN